MEPHARQFVRALEEQHKPMAVICHAPLDAGIRRHCAWTETDDYHTIQDDMRKAGANWVDQDVVVDGNLAISRKPDDIPAFNREFSRLLESGVPAGAR
jgi:protease I